MYPSLGTPALDTPLVTTGVQRNFWLAKSMTSRHLRMRRMTFQIMHFASDCH